MSPFSKLTFGLLAASGMLLGGVQNASAQQAYFIQSVAEFNKSRIPANKVLDVPWALTTNVLPWSPSVHVWIQQFTRNNQTNQQWVEEYVGYINGQYCYRFRNVNSGLYMTMLSSDNGSAITQEPSYPSWAWYFPTQLWTFQFRGYLSDGHGGLIATYALKNGYATSKSMNVSDPVAGDNAVIRIWTDYPPNNNGVFNQAWIFWPAN